MPPWNTEDEDADGVFGKYEHIDDPDVCQAFEDWDEVEEMYNAGDELPMFLVVEGELYRRK